MAATLRTFATSDSAGKKSLPGPDWSMFAPTLPAAATNSAPESSIAMSSTRAVAFAAPRGVDDRDIEGRGVVDGGDGLRVEAAGVVVFVDELEGHDLDARRDADDASAVQRRRDGPGDVGAVAVEAGVMERRVVVAEIPAVDVVDEVVVVVVDAVAGDLARVGPGPAGQIGMAEVDAVVDDGHHDLGHAERDAQRLEPIDVDVGDAGL